MKKSLFFIILFLGLVFIHAVQAQFVFQSNQVGTSPAAGRVLQTNGATSTWVTTSSLGISGGGATSTINAGSATSTGPAFIFTANSTTSDWSVVANGAASVAYNFLASSTWLKAANNLSDLASTTASLTNLGLTGTSTRILYFGTDRRPTSSANLTYSGTGVVIGGSASSSIYGDGITENTFGSRIVAYNGEDVVARGQGAGTVTGSSIWEDNSGGRDTEIYYDGGTGTWKFAAGDDVLDIVAGVGNGNGTWLSGFRVVEAFNASSTAIVEGATTLRSTLTQSGGVVSLSSTTITGHTTSTGLSLTSVTGSIPYATSTGRFQALTVGSGLTLSNGTLSTADTYSTSTGANPSASVGLSAVNGSANTFLRSDGAPALSQSIVPTWSGAHIFTGGLTVNSTSTHNSSTIMTGTTQITNTLQIPTSTTPASAGQIAVKTTSSTLNFYDGTAERVLNPEICTDGFNIENPTTTEDIVYFRPKATSTITSFHSVHKAGGDTVTFNLVWDDDRSNASGTSRHLWTANVTSSNTTTGDTYPTLVAFASTTVDAGDWVRLLTSAASSSQWSSTLCYRFNP